jgi:hypothetical protein
VRVGDRPAVPRQLARSIIHNPFATHYVQRSMCNIDPIRWLSLNGITKGSRP